MRVAVGGREVNVGVDGARVGVTGCAATNVVRVGTGVWVAAGGLVSTTAAGAAEFKASTVRAITVGRCCVGTGVA